MKKEVINGLHVYCCAIRGKGEMTGKQFADECRKVWSDKNPKNAFYYGLFEKHILSVNYLPNGQIKIRHGNYS